MYEESFLPAESHRPQLRIITMNLNPQQGFKVRLSGRLDRPVTVFKQKQSIERYEYPVDRGTSDIDVFLDENITESTSSIGGAPTQISLINGK